MKVEVWSDFACPFCYIGKRRLEQALADSPHRDQIEVEYRSFELDPGAARDAGMNVHQMLAAKYGMPLEQAQTMNRQLSGQAAAEGLDFQFDRTILTNTFDAHRLAQYARTQGRAAELTELLLKGYFTDGLHLGDADTLLGLAKAVGLDEQEAAAVLAGDRYADEVRSDEQRAARLGIRGVPFYLLDGKLAVSGAQQAEAFRQALEQAWAEHTPPPAPLQAQADEACSDGLCAPVTTNKPLIHD
ncbi:DsbA family oxidoreductase [Paenibacillus sp. IB182496]|uniref:DsbA family oxidoreductase n=1 Tax=Paenibacillus sabuli TaxID=2772509 RepID=A0A927BRM8_9BACL|nr:DsbA family oxidoreductase [Paenibacillus sabuli]MBD2844208.1 DsbA family oxidoreductase [Paenibacillus sabuli]